MFVGLVRVAEVVVRERRGDGSGGRSMVVEVVKGIVVPVEESDTHRRAQVVVGHEVLVVREVLLGESMDARRSDHA